MMSSTGYRNTESLEQQLQAAKDALEAVKVRAENLRDKTPVDHGMFSGTRRKFNAKATARQFARNDREAAAFAAIAPAELKVRRIEAAIAERDRVRFTRDDLVGATHVRVKDGGWRKVRRLNAKTVSVDSGYSWADLIPFEKITDHRTVKGPCHV